VLTKEELRAESDRVSGLITDLDVSDEEVDAAIAAFKKLDADPDELNQCVLCFGLTMEVRSPDHMGGPGSRKPVTPRTILVGKPFALPQARFDAFDAAVKYACERWQAARRRETWIVVDDDAGDWPEEGWQGLALPSAESSAALVVFRPME
jgi:hypothetical protein